MVETTRRRDSDLLQPAVFLLADLIALQAAFLLTYWIRFSSGWMATPLGVPPFELYVSVSLLMLPVFAGIFYAQGLYDPARRKRLEDDFIGLFRAVVAGSLVVLAGAFFVREATFSRTFFVLFFGISLLFLFCARVVARAGLRRYLQRGVGMARVLFVGESGMKARLLETIDSLPGLGFVPIGSLSVEAGEPGVGFVEVGEFELPILGNLEDLETVVRDHDIDCVMLTLRFERLALVTDVAERLGPFHVDVQFVPDMQQIRASRMRLKEIAGIPFIGVREGDASRGPRRCGTRSEHRAAGAPCPGSANVAAGSTTSASSPDAQSTGSTETSRSSLAQCFAQTSAPGGREQGVRADEHEPAQG